MPYPLAHFNLTLYANASNIGGATPDLGEYGVQIEDLDFTTIAPGGCGDLKCRLRILNPRLYRPHLRIFSNVVLTQADALLFVGRLDEPAYIVSDTDGEYVELTVMGGGTTFKDDPEDASYSGKTAIQIITDQLQGGTLGRANWINIDADLSQVLPDNPSTVYTYNPQAKTIEDVLNEILACQGDYLWYIWPHQLNRDAVGMPTWQLWATKRDTTTVHYQGILADESGVDFRPAIEYCFNAINVRYKDATTGMPAKVTVQDGRLNINKSQGTAPFPYRLLVKDLSSYNLSSTQATAIANAYLKEYQNGGFKITVKLHSVTDGNGAPLPLAQIRAGKNIFLPEITPTNPQLSFVATTNNNLFFIQQTHYQETEGQTPTVELTLNSFKDTEAFQVARLEYVEGARNRRVTRTHGQHQAVGETERGTFGIGWGSNAVSTDTFEQGVNYKVVMVNVPSSITLTPSTSTNANTPTVAAITQTGFSIRVQPTANGAGLVRGQYATVGN